MTDPLNIIFLTILIYGIWNLVQLSIYSTRALYHKYFVAKFVTFCLTKSYQSVL